jgi:hypothetical protein
MRVALHAQWIGGSISLVMLCADVGEIACGAMSLPAYSPQLKGAVPSQLLPNTCKLTVHLEATSLSVQRPSYLPRGQRPLQDTV